MPYPKPHRKRQYFSLFELIIVIGILAIFLFMCSNTLILTLSTKEMLGNAYTENRVKSIGWNILSIDLSNAVGKFYLEGTVPVAPTPKKPADAKKTSDQKKTKAKASPKVPRLFVFNAEPNLDEPFLEVVVSRGRVKRSSENAGAIHSFKLVKYYLREHPEDEGQIILRTEEVWKKEQDDDKVDIDEEEFDLESDYRRFTVLESYTDFEFRVYDGKKWQEEWNSVSNQDLPLAMKVTCTKIIADEDNGLQDLSEEEELEIERILPIPLSYLPVQKPEDEDF